MFRERRVETGEQVGPLQEKLGEWGVTTVVFDLDGTLVDTRRVFDEAGGDACGFLVCGDGWWDDEIRQKVGEEVEERKKFMWEVIYGVREEFGVNPAIMEWAVHVTTKRWGLEPTDFNYGLAIGRVRDIYRKDVPKVFAGAKEAVDLFNEAGVDSILVTHSEEEWMWHKLIATGFVGKFREKVCLSVDEPKSGQWEGVFEKLGLLPNEVLVIGDDWKADIVPAVRLGARAMLVTNEREEPFSGEVGIEVLTKEEEARVMKIVGMGGLVDAVIEK